MSRVDHWTRRWRCSLTIAVTLFLLIAARWLHTCPGRAYGVGLVLAVLGQSLRVWAAGTLHKETELTDGGPYALTRNPLYLGSFVIALGHLLMSGLVGAAVVILPAFWVVYGATIRYEEERLLERFGSAYVEYRERVPRLFPRRLRRLPRGSFSWRQVIRNREYEAVLANLLAAIVFAL